MNDKKIKYGIANTAIGELLDQEFNSETEANEFLKDYILELFEDDHQISEKTWPYIDIDLVIKDYMMDFEVDTIENLKKDWA